MNQKRRLPYNLYMQVILKRIHVQRRALNLIRNIAHRYTKAGHAVKEIDAFEF